MGIEETQRILQNEIDKILHIIDKQVDGLEGFVFDDDCPLTNKQIEKVLSLANRLSQLFTAYKMKDVEGEKE